MKLLFLFLDGIGLGKDEPEINPFAAVNMPNLENLLEGHRLTQPNGSTPINTERATLLALDACLGIDGRPQSASGQASLLTGINVPAQIGQHFGPKPSIEISDIIEKNNLFSELNRIGQQACLINAFPEEYFETINSGRRLPGALALSSIKAGIPLKTTKDLFEGNALSADFTAQGWRTHLKYHDTPLLTPDQAGIRLAQLADKYNFLLFEHWLSDYIGHKRNMNAAEELLTIFDQVLGGLLLSWDDDQGLILITSDHGNMENLAIRNHTRNKVPAIIIGSSKLRQAFTKNLVDITNIYPAIIDILNVSNY